MKSPPVFFEHIRAAASQRWDQLDNDRDLAGPWHQLFKQVQSPRHVVSELLQNADDAGATEASVDVLDGEFVFSHNGEDFCEEHFASLCRFGYSNKRALHTIGFRGIGFKSTFSLGNEVRVITPTLSVIFRRRRFTEPFWESGTEPLRGRTEIRVVIQNAPRQQELEKNLKEWLNSPASLLFFRSIRCLRIGEKEVRWVPAGQGPVDNSEWMALSNLPDKKYLLIRSSPEEFPHEALEEIVQERMIYGEEEVEFPPCRVEIVLGMEGRLFVILPTDVRTRLPFACNAPFVQDPARLKIKDLAISPTNRWLLKRIANLAAEVMICWVNRSDLPPDERCQAYGLLPDAKADGVTLEENCRAIVKDTFEAIIKGQKFLLTEQIQTVGWQECVAVPPTLASIWSADQISAFIIQGQCPILCQQIEPHNLANLCQWDCVGRVDKQELLSVMKRLRLPKPVTWAHVLTLWAYIHEDITGYARDKYKDVRLIPVQGKDDLYAAAEVTRLGERKLLQSDDDWEFLAKYLLVMNPNWTRFLADQRREAGEREDAALGKKVESAYAVLSSLNLINASDVNRVVEKVADEFFLQTTTREDCVHLTHLVAKLGATLPPKFRLIVRNGSTIKISEHVAVDLDEDMDAFVEEEWCNGHVLHEAYSASFTNCTKEEWRNWVSSGRSGLLTFVPLTPSNSSMYNRDKVTTWLRERGFVGDPSFPYKGSDFRLKDWDFDKKHWQHWHGLAKEDPSFYWNLLARALKQPDVNWSKEVKAIQVAGNGYWQVVNSQPLIPAWILRFRDLACLQDTWGGYHQPAELLRRTPETESLLDVEPFVRAEFDNETTRPILIMLGVRDNPTGPERLLERLAALAKVSNSPLYEIEKWYHRLDKMLANCSTDELMRVKEAFRDDAIILTETNIWAKAGEVFLASDEEDVPDAALIHPTFRHLALWHRIGVAERPTTDLAIAWLKNLPSGKTASPDEARRIHALLARHPFRVWHECGHWLNLEVNWVRTESLTHCLTMQSLVPWKHLFPAVKQQTADFQKLPVDVSQQSPFSALPTLASSLEECAQESLASLSDPQQKPWSIALGAGLRRIVLDDTDEARRIRDLASSLAQSDWQVVEGLETIPYLQGVPVGTPRRIKILWREHRFYVTERSAPRMAGDVIQELSRAFARPEITEAIKICYERPTDFIEEYLIANFRLISLEDFNLLEDHSTVNENPLKQMEPTPNIDLTRSEDTVDERRQPDYTEHEPVPEAPTETSSDSTGDAPIRPHPKPVSPPEPSVMERFAFTRGYRKDGTDRFYHSDGSLIVRTNGGAFPWEKFSPSGELLQAYWPKDHCIHQDPLKIEAEIWGLCDKFPDKYSLILSDRDDRPIEMSGERLRDMCEMGELTIHPAMYRIVYTHAESDTADRRI